MSYASQQDLIDRYGLDELIQRTDRDRAGIVNDEVVALALADADATINGHIGSAYHLPLQEVPRILVGFACDIARYKLFGDAAPEEVRNRYKDAIKFLELVGQKKLTLGLADGQQVPSSGGVNFKTPGRVINDNSLSGF